MMEYGLLGEKLSHSFSKDIHTKYFGLNYELKELPPEAVEVFLAERNFKAINVTIPYKRTVMPYLDFISEEAEKIGAVNVVVNREGKLYGYNTDFLGLKAMIEKSGTDIKDKNVLILGDGATSKTACAVAQSQKAKTIKVASRKNSENTVSYSEISDLVDTEIIINTTPVGMYPNVSKSLVNISDFPNLLGVFDVVYNPLCSKLVVDALNSGITACGGLYMLVAQAVLSAQIFGINSADFQKIDSIFSDIIKEKQNIVLVGMPGSGKTTVGKILAQRLNKKFIDTDSLIEAKYGKITDIFKNFGEDYFRQIESEIIKELATVQSAVISTGGGAVLRGENVDFLKQNGKIYFLDRPLDKITATDDRPLSQNREMLKQRYDERYEIYCNCCDAHIISNSTIDDTVSSIEGDFLE